MDKITKKSVRELFENEYNSLQEKIIDIDISKKYSLVYIYTMSENHIFYRYVYDFAIGWKYIKCEMGVWR